MKPGNILHLYRARVRARYIQECLAIAGIAAGVALLFASQVASTSLKSSVTQLSRGVVGSATLQLVARDPHGFSQSLLVEVRRIPGVRVAAPIMQTAVNAKGPRGSASIELIGADASLSALGGSLVRRAALSPFGDIGAVVLPAPLAYKLGVTKFGEEVELQSGGRTESVPLYALLHASQVGPLIGSPVAIAPLLLAQEATGRLGRLSRILIAPAAGSQASVQTALQSLAAGRLDVESTDHEAKLFATAATAASQSSVLFSVISALVGFLFAFNAMLLTVPQRRRLIAELRVDGYAPPTVIAVLLLDALVLGLLGCALGLAVGEELSIHFLRAQPAFFSLAFAVGAQRVVSAQSIAIATFGGLAAAIVAILSPVRDILARDPLAAIRTGEDPQGARSERRQAVAGLTSLIAATLLLLLAPDAAIPAMVLLVGALLLMLPLALSVSLTLLRAVARTIVSPVPHVAVMELSGARTRALAITATGAVAVFGSVAIHGARADLLAGLENAARATNAFTDLWVSPAGSYNLLETTPFTPVHEGQLRQLPGVRGVRDYRGALLDYGARRALVIAPPRTSVPLLPPDQLVQGSSHQAEERVRAGGWLVLSRALAAEHHLHVGESFQLPSPVPQTFRVAALATNIGWAPGAIAMNAGDYARAWGSGDISAYNILLARHASAAQVVREIKRALGPDSGLTVETAAAHTEQQQALDRTALARLSEIGTLIPIFAVLAMAASIGAMIWQRRPRLAKLKLEGLSRALLWRTLLLESTLLLGIGSLSGSLYGLYGQRLADRALASVIDFPVIYSLAPLALLSSLALLAATALALLAVPGYLATSVPAALALQD